MLATERCGVGGSRQRRVGGAHLWALPDSVNGFLQFYFTAAQEPQKSAVFGRFWTAVGRVGTAIQAPDTPESVVNRARNRPFRARWRHQRSV